MLGVPLDASWVQLRLQVMAREVPMLRYSEARTSRTKVVVKMKKTDNPSINMDGYEMVIVVFALVVVEVRRCKIK
jgi:hypothetical protein